MSTPRSAVVDSPPPSTTTPGLDDPGVVLSALRTVLLYSIATPFVLLPEERMWASWQLGVMLAPLAGRLPQKVPVAVRQELDDGV